MAARPRCSGHQARWPDIGCSAEAVFSIQVNGAFKRGACAHHLAQVLRSELRSTTIAAAVVREYRTERPL